MHFVVLLILLLFVFEWFHEVKICLYAIEEYSQIYQVKRTCQFDLLTFALFL